MNTCADARSCPVFDDVTPVYGLFHGFTGVIFPVLQTLNLHDLRESSLSDLPDDSIICSKPTAKKQ